MPTRSRRGHHKVRSGCVTCKARRLKCDEEKPECKRCIKAGIKCKGYNAPKAWIFELPTTAADSKSYSDTEEHRHLDSAGNVELGISLDQLTLRGTLPFSIDSLRSAYTGYNASRISILFEFTFLVYGPNFVWRYHTTEQEQHAFASRFIHLCTQETALLEALLAISTRYLAIELASPNFSEQDSLQHHGRALRILQERLLSESAPFQEEIYWTVIAIMRLNQERNDWQSFAINLAGLQRIVRLRGGINTMKVDSPRAPTFYAWALFTYAQYEKSRQGEIKSTSPRLTVNEPLNTLISGSTGEEEPQLPKGIQDMIDQNRLCPELVSLCHRVASWFVSEKIADRTQLAYDLDQLLHHHPLQPQEYMLGIGMFVLLLSHPPTVLVENYPPSLDTYVKTANEMNLKTTKSTWLLWSSILIASTPVCFNLAPADRWKLFNKYIADNPQLMDFSDARALLKNFFLPEWLEVKWADCWIVASSQLDISIESSP